MAWLAAALLLMCSHSLKAAWEAEFAAFASQDAASPPPANVILFSGSSSIRGWPDLPGAFPGYPVLNRGFGGSVMTDVLDRFDDLVTRYRPPLIVLYEGDNDIAGGLTPAQVFASYETFVNRVAAEQPGTDIAIIAVKPSPSRVSVMPQMAALNAMLSDLCAQRSGLVFVDVFSPMLNTSGQPRPELFQSDMLHMNAAGYSLWQSLLQPVLAGAPYTRGEAVLVDFGAAGGETVFGPAGDPENHWNNVTTQTGTTPGAVLTGLVNAMGTATPLSLEIVDRFNGANESGTLTAPEFPAAASRDSLFGNTGDFQGLSNVLPRFRLAGLDPARTWNLTFFASRTGGSAVRETRYTAIGATTESVLLDATDNTSTSAVISGLSPAADGSITVALSPGPGNTTAEQFTYLGVLMVEPVALPPADTLPPAVASAAYLPPAQVRVTFSEELAAASIGPVSGWTAATSAGNLSALSAALQPDGRSVLLEFSTLPPGQVTVSIPGVQDLAGNTANGLTAAVIVPEVSAPAILLDFGSTVTAAADDPARTWNSVTVGTSDTGVMQNLKTVTGSVSSAALRMVRRFNGANTNGTTASTLYPAPATSDSLFGNTETFSSLTNVFPAFRLTGLHPAAALDLTFYASRMGVSDNRSTLYTVTGHATGTAVLNAANNINGTVTVRNVRPDAAGEILIGLTPAAANTNTNHFTYLGVLQVSPAVPVSVRSFVRSPAGPVIDWQGHGIPEWADHPAGPWTAVQPPPDSPWTDPQPALLRRFYRVRERFP